MEASGFTLFDTAIGCCGIAWGPAGLTDVQLPESSRAATRARLLRQLPPAAREHAPSELPPEIADAVARIVALLAGADDDLADVAVDMERVPPFHRRVYDLARTIPPGATLTYGEVADRIGADRGAARAVGQALGANPVPIVVPCHRVTAAGGKTGGFSAGGGVSTKLRMLDIERAHAAAHGAPTLF
ncbi:methylated-DNA--[protein]-cysteine S-methyltransferase [Conexibacter woesei]|uniref:Methylated-DNA/protein-cysteinemethyltransferase n=1 Tax=Conexibacter woesei (strain DSM 14684 / CCUG 47730 / CIP 108061 / JCM 11494 / NBRC 100937 / ID131577) TaxID=469383 RepID=D3FD03_CONWI|nr:methylated-DNA--[protein]-cysteine S-methyltransferase [Conexibacter woesei]ADB51515.1 methylated-DNA/protein-cysteinemethyltransferase [Conexibacter woesei DSM 14684]